MSSAAPTYADRAIAYATRVTTGAEVAGHYERAACARFLRDLKRQHDNDAAFPYVFDAARGARACRFIELLPHVKGEWARPTVINGESIYKTIELADWQVFCEIQLFGWIHRATGLRRFRRSYEEVARKNAKSTRAAGRALYLLLPDNEPGAQVYSAATTGAQAREVFDTARHMCLCSPKLLERWGVVVGANRITVPGSASQFGPLNAKAESQDGLNVHCAIVDEVHAHRNRALWDVIESADGARSQSLISAITTAGTNRSGICYELRTYTTKVLDQVVSDETWFGIIYTLDAGDDWHDPAVWRKANPNLGVSVSIEGLRATVRKALAQPSAVNNVKTKHLNIWCSSDSPWLSAEDWNACADDTLRLTEWREAAPGMPLAVDIADWLRQARAHQLERFHGRRAFIGLDLAEKADFAAAVIVIEPGDDSPNWTVIPRLYHNEAAIDDAGNAHLKAWADAGHVIVSTGNVTDLDMVAADLADLCQLLDVQEIDFDPALSRYFASKLIEQGLPMVEIRQASTFFTQPVIQVENMVLEGTLKHDGNPVMAWMVSNVQLTVSKFSGLRHPTKARDADKIDGPVAMFLGLGRALEGTPQTTVITADDCVFA